MFAPGCNNRVFCMGTNYIEDKVFEKINYTVNGLPKAEYDNCTFKNCDLSNVNLSHITFSQCRFDNCNLSLALLGQTAFKEVTFSNCKMLGLHFEHCSDFLFEVSFDNCQLNMSVFYQRKMPKSLFNQCTLVEVDFTEANLSQAVLAGCDLSGAMFDRTNLEKADLSTAFNYVLDPEKNKIKKAKFSMPGVMGLLVKYDIKVV